ncbi:DUF2786 domain-containing protein [Aerococcaceae bacterium zg-ZJ1578]|uniref:DUF2786 domain-containing protein n=1 Tax=Aerococcaceae bacterium zg-252 TaxID=2796928 RepID=UPI001A31E2CD|nr:DUF2786 domain-containing protein [Aerococcaceae bacterium zg-1578]MBR7928264.1 DUF2786 domain-containing protein [Aerococcaceae bacterium zg-ZUI334]
MSVNDKILDKIRNLLKLAEDGANDEESQTALLMAQKLMLKHKISQNELNETGQNEIVLKSLSVYKRLFWWEKSLATIIATNFRVMLYVQSNRMPYQTSTMRKIVYMGYPEDTELAYEVFHLAAESMKYHASYHLKSLQEENQSFSLADLRKAYYKGFIDGLNEKFEQQRREMQSENVAYEIMVQVPNEVKAAFDQQVSGRRKLTYRSPQFTKEDATYLEGYQKGTQMSLTRNFLDNENK